MGTQKSTHYELVKNRGEEKLENIFTFVTHKMTSEMIQLDGRIYAADS